GEHKIDVYTRGRLELSSPVRLPEDRDLFLHLRVEPSRNRGQRAILWGLVGATGIATGLAAVYGGLAWSDQSSFNDHPNLMLRATGEDHAFRADVCLISAAILGATAAVYTYATSPGPPRIEADR